MKSKNFYSIAAFIEAYYPEYYSYERYPADQCVRIHKVKEEWGIFGNFAGTELLCNGVRFKSSEHLFQTMKFQEADIVGTVYCSPHVKMTAKHYEKEHRRADWGRMVIDAMKFCLQTKYDQSELFRNELERSKGKYIVEDQSSFPKKNPDAWGVKLDEEKGEYYGPNVLGRLLMELREKGHLDYELPDDILNFTELLK